MPKLSLWKNGKTQDYYYQDRVIREMMDASGTGMLIHKYLGPAAIEDGSDPAKPNLAAKSEITELDIQDLLFIENRDRVYDTTIYELRGTYNVSDQDFDLSQFGLFLNSDTLFITFNTNEMVNILGRRLMPGDVIELPHLNDDLVLDTTAKSINKFYAVQDAARAAEGFGPSWWSHLWRIKVSPINDAQEYRSILGDPEDEDSLKNALSIYQTEIQISNAIVESAAVNTPNTGYATSQQNDVTFSPIIDVMNGNGKNAIQVNTVENTPTTGVPSGINFPQNPTQGELFQRADFTPTRLFVYRGNKWFRIMDNLNQLNWSNNTLNAGTFINDANTTSTSGPNGNVSVPERQPLSKVFTKPRADN